MVGFVVGVALVPFVSRFRLFGIFEFRRDIEKLKDEMKVLQNDVSAISAVTVGQSAAAQLQQQIIVTTQAVEMQVSQAEGPRPPGADTSEWDALWWQFELLVTLHHVKDIVSEKGAEALDEVRFDNIEDRFKQGLLALKGDETVPAFVKPHIEKLALRVEPDGKAAPPNRREFLDALLHVSSFLAGSLSLTTTMDRAIVAGITRDPRSLVKSLTEVVDKLTTLRLQDSHATESSEVDNRDQPPAAND
jgi:hypothetical protein